MGDRVGSSLRKVIALAAALVALAPAAARGDSASCSYDSLTHTATVTLSRGPGSGATGAVFSVADGALFVMSGETPSATCGSATNQNTDTIVVENSSTSQQLKSIFYLYAPDSTIEEYGPGFTPEPGSSDEIEVSVNFGSGGTLGFRSLGSGPVDLALGGNRINLNPSEPDGIDPDVTVNGATGGNVTPYGVLIDGGGQPDSILAGGGAAGTPATPFVASMEVFGGNAHDLIVGGSRSDKISGAGGPDVLRGRGGRDRIEGGPGADALSGGRQIDRLLGGPGRDVLNGGPGRLDFCALGDRRIRCELPRG